MASRARTSRRDDLSRAAFAVLVVGGLSALAPHLLAQTTDDLFNAGVVHRVDLLMHSQDWEKLKDNFQENTYYPVDVSWSGQTARNSGVRSRGLGSRSATKPGLRLDFDRYASDQTFLGLKSLVLDNLTQDKSGVRESVAMAFFTRLGVPAPRESFARVYMNDRFIGLYAIVESVDKDLLARVFGAADGNVQNDGYLYEYNYLLGAPWRFEYLGSELESYAQRFDAKTHESHSPVEKWGPIEDLVRLVNDPSDNAFASALPAKLDLPALIRFVAAQNFVAEDDGFLGYDGINNFYFYRLEDRDQHVLIAWDDDNAFLTPHFGLTQRHDENVLMRRLMAIPEYRGQYFSALTRAADSASESGEGQPAAWLQGELTRQLNLIAEAMRQDPSKPYSNEEHEAARDALLAFAPARISYVRCEVARQTDQPLPPGC